MNTNLNQTSQYLSRKSNQNRTTSTARRLAVTTLAVSAACLPLLAGPTATISASPESDALEIVTAADLLDLADVKLVDGATEPRRSLLSRTAEREATKARTKPQRRPAPRPQPATTRKPVTRPAAPQPSAAPAPAPAPQPAPPAPVSGGIIAIAQSYLGVPYVYGGSTPSGFDCSGFTSYVFAQAGKSLPRTSSAQAAATIRISASQAVPGDLVFFTGSGGVYHVGIYAGGGSIIHSPRPGTSVRYEQIWTSSVFYGRVR